MNGRPRTAQDTETASAMSPTVIVHLDLVMVLSCCDKIHLLPTNTT
ncbi:MAG: hypothetical protein ACXU9G_08070 [Syntrophales bacterium]